MNVELLGHDGQPVNDGDLIALAGPQSLRDLRQAPNADVREWRDTSFDRQAWSNDASGTTADASDPLAALWLEYRQALMHRERASAHDLSSSDRYRGSPVPDDPFAPYSERLSGGSLLEDLLGAQHLFGAVVAELDRFGDHTLFAEEPTTEILRLLAPPGAAIQPNPPAAQLAQREHHMISMDSHFQISSSTTDASREAA
ncbi:TagK domain-containing protein [Paraherbaspirillum soli]|uniref:TagK domain-containing protein n=1 Tax=Paraherbaspirillum soli TaxID=631222 RepID=A0ABW0M2S6_9BURK